MAAQKIPTSQKGTIVVLKCWIPCPKDHYNPFPTYDENVRHGRVLVSLCDVHVPHGGAVSDQQQQRDCNTQPCSYLNYRHQRELQSWQFNPSNAVANSDRGICLTEGGGTCNAITVHQSFLLTCFQNAV